MCIMISKNVIHDTGIMKMSMKENERSIFIAPNDLDSQCCESGPFVSFHDSSVMYCTTPLMIFTLAPISKLGRVVLPWT